MKENIISGIIGGLFVLICQLTYDYIKNKKLEKKKLRVGNSELSILDRDFLYKYEPHKYSIEKILSDFGQPFKKYNDRFEELEVEIYQYNFQNAKILFSKGLDTSEILSVTLFSLLDKKNPTLCRLSFEDNEIEMGKAVINDIIVRDSVSISNNTYTFEPNCTIQAKYSYRQIKHLTFSYQIKGNFKTVQQTKGQLIQQVCISQLSYVTPMLSTNDTFYV